MAKLTPLQKAVSIAAIIGTLATVTIALVNVTNVFKLPSTSTGQTITQSGTGIASGRDTVINGLIFNSQPPVALDDTIYQAGIVVGKVFGGRRTPNDATLFEFKEITQASQFNINAEFEYQGYILKPISFYSHVGLTSSRPQDGTIITGLLAKVVRAK
jgi:hypothetical protein